MLVEFSGGFKDETHGYLIPETFNKVARFDLATTNRIISSLDIGVNGKDVSGFSGGFISGDYGYLVPNKSNELVRFSTNQNNTTIINSDDKFTLNTFKSEDPITIDKNRSYNLTIDFSYLMAVDQENIPYEDVSMMVEIKPSSDISYFYNYDNSGSAGPGQSDDISNVVRITDLSYSEAFNFTFARKSDSDLSMMITLRDNCNNTTAGNAVYKVIDFAVNENNAAEEGNFDATYDLALRDRKISPEPSPVSTPRVCEESKATCLVHTETLDDSFQQLRSLSLDIDAGGRGRSAFFDKSTVPDV